LVSTSRALGEVAMNLVVHHWVGHLANLVDQDPSVRWWSWQLNSGSTRLAEASDSSRVKVVPPRAVVLRVLMQWVAAQEFEALEFETHWVEAHWVEAHWVEAPKIDATALQEP
jgi:hypothetical protein